MLKRVALLTALLFGLALSAQETPEAVKTDWLSDESGNTGRVLGAEVLAVKTEKDFSLIDIAIPQMQQYSSENMVVEFFSEDEKPHEKRPVKHKEVLLDNEGKPYGVRVKLKKPRNFEFRLYLHLDADQKQD